MFLPNKPEGLNNRITIRMINAAASRNVEDKNPLTNASMTPSSTPPTMAPGMTPIPPRTAATNALSPGYDSHQRVNGVVVDSDQNSRSSGQTRADGKSNGNDPVHVDSHEPGASVSKETARIALPTFVWLTTYVRMNINAREMIRITICWLLTTIPKNCRWLWETVQEKYGAAV